MLNLAKHLYLFKDYKVFIENYKFVMAVLDFGFGKLTTICIYLQYIVVKDTNLNS